MISILSRKFFDKLRRKSYREAYVEESVRTGVAYQIRAIREQRGWSQKKLADILGKPQSVVSRIEDPDYGKLSVQTLLEVAAALDVALLIQYVDFPELIARTRDVSPQAMHADGFSEDQFLVVEPRADISAHVYALGGPISGAMAGSNLALVSAATNAVLGATVGVVGGGCGAALNATPLSPLPQSVMSGWPNLEPIGAA